MKTILMFLLVGSSGIIYAQTNAPAQNPPEQQVEISSDKGYFDDNPRQMVYSGHVLVIDAKTKLRCEQLVVNLPQDGGRPTNIVAETNVVIDAVDEKGQTNHITADKAVYDYSVVNSVTNATVTFTGGNPTPKVENPQFTLLGEPLVWNVMTKQFSGSNYKTIFKQTPSSNKDTNALPFNF